MTDYPYIERRAKIRQEMAEAGYTELCPPANGGMLFLSRTFMAAKHGVDLAGCFSGYNKNEQPGRTECGPTNRPTKRGQDGRGPEEVV